VFIEFALILGVIALFGRRVSGFQAIVAYAICHVLYLILITVTYRFGLLADWGPFEYYGAYGIFMFLFLIGLPRFVNGAKWGLPLSLGCAAALSMALKMPFQDYDYLFLPEYEEIAETGEDSGPPPIDTEQLYYAQSDLMDKQLKTLDGASDAQPNLFAILGAGTSDQRVFIREVVSVSEILKDQFGDETPVIKLANSDWEPDRFPLSNRTNIETALTQTAKAMDPSKDVALLFLTSHGSQDRFSLSFGQMRMNSLGADDLSKMLDRSGERS